MVKIKGLQSFRSFEQIEDEGVWFPMGPGIEFRIRRMRSKIVERAKDRIYGPHERAMRGKDLPDELELELTKRLLSQAVVVDWRGEGMVDDQDQPFPFSADNCYALLSDPEIGKDLRGAVISASMDGSIFVPDEGAEGNSVPSSSGISGTANT